MDRELLSLFIDADRLSAEVLGTTSPNPPVGALILSPSGEVIGRGATQPAGGAHAEVMALRDAQRTLADLRGCRAVVTLEPCNHTGRTGPCTEALVKAGISTVDFLFSDPHQPAAGGAQRLEEASVHVTGPWASQPGMEQSWERRWVLEPWLRSIALKRPYVCLKWAATADGFTAAKDRGSQWITGELARTAVHEDRCQRDAIVVGTGTVRSDNPQLTARDSSGQPYPLERQPLRVVIGETEVPSDATIIGNDGKFLQISTHSISEALNELGRIGVVNVLVEGGARLAGAVMTAGVVDEVQLYLAPSVLGGGLHPLAAAAGETMDDIVRFTPRDISRWGSDIRWTLTRPATEEV